MDCGGDNSTFRMLASRRVSRPRRRLSLTLTSVQSGSPAPWLESYSRPNGLRKPIGRAKSRLARWQGVDLQLSAGELVVLLGRQDPESPAEGARVWPVSIASHCVDVVLAEDVDTAKVQRDLEWLQRERRNIGPGKADDFTVRDMTWIAETQAGTTQMPTGLLAAVAAVQVLAQFLVEAVVLSLFGGVVGIVLGLALA
jgi:hypothetical protein